LHNQLPVFLHTFFCARASLSSPRKPRSLVLGIYGVSVTSIPGVWPRESRYFLYGLAKFLIDAASVILCYTLRYDSRSINDRLTTKGIINGLLAYRTNFYVAKQSNRSFSTLHPTKLFHSSSSTKLLTTPTKLFITLHLQRSFLTTLHLQQAILISPS